MHSELFEFYTPTKDSLSKPMPEWIFHTERGSEGEPRRIKERRKKNRRRREGERHRERQGGGESEGEAAERCWLAGEH